MPRKVVVDDAVRICNPALPDLAARVADVPRVPAPAPTPQPAPATFPFRHPHTNNAPPHHAPAPWNPC